MSAVGMPPGQDDEDYHRQVFGPEPSYELPDKMVSRVIHAIPVGFVLAQMAYGTSKNSPGLGAYVGWTAFSMFALGVFGLGLYTSGLEK